jgi:hypothetical protein
VLSGSRFSMLQTLKGPTNLMEGPFNPAQLVCVKWLLSGDGGDGEDKRDGGSGHRSRLRSTKGKPLFFERGANDTGGCRHGRPGWQGEALQYREDPSRLFFGMVLTR